LNKHIFVLFLIFLLSIHVTAQENDDLFNIDIDSLFEDSFTDENDISEPDTDTTPVKVNKTGILFGASYEFQGGIAPGWTLAPWHFDGTEEFSWGLGAKMLANLSINAQLSEYFRVYSSLGFNILDFKLNLGDFFFDYNFYNAVFVRAGKYEHTWGHSDFTNLLSRVPVGGPSGPSYIFKTDIPIGVGGFQTLILTRVDIANGIIPEKWEDMAFGGKYNIALRWFDIDMGILYQHNMMPVRGFVSIKTTLGKTEIYNEWLVAVNTHTDNAASMAAGIGLARDFFDNKLTLGGSLFYNGERNAVFYKPETSFSKEERYENIPDQFQIGLNLLYRIDGKISPRIFTSLYYSTSDNSFQFVPGFKFSPFNNIEVYFAVPMALGGKDGYYYKHNADPQNRPFSIMLLVTLKGSVYTGSF
jgi:hypothetical protein